MAMALRPKIRMKDIGHEYGGMRPTDPSSLKSYPSFSVDAEKFPHLKNLEVGKEHHIRARVVKKAHHVGEDGKHRMEIEVRSMGEEKTSPRGKSKLEENGY